MGLRTLDDAGFSGMQRDEASWLLKKGQLYDALNMLFDRPGVARQRGGTTGIFSGAQTAFATILGFQYAQDTTPLEELYAVDGKTGEVYCINKTTGVATNIVAYPSALNLPVLFGRPVRHLGWCVFNSVSLSSFAQRNILFCGGMNVNFAAYSHVTTALSSSFAGSNRLTLTGADTTATAVVGMYVTFFHTGIAVPYQYHGRITDVIDATHIAVWPPPTITDAAIPIGQLQWKSFYGTGGGGGKCATSFQNRLLLGNTQDALGGAAPAAVADRRFYYSVLPTETGQVAAPGTSLIIGSAFMVNGGYPPYNYIEIPGADPIVAMEPISENQLLILTSGRAYVFRGNLVTQLSTTSQQVTFDVSEIPGLGSCISDLGVQRTPDGVIWAGFGGIYAWQGSGEPVDLTDRQINTLWVSLVRGANFAVHGSAFVRGTYYVAGTSAGSTFVLGYNTHTNAWGRYNNMDIFLGVARPTDPSQVFALRWYDQTGVAPSMTNGQAIRLESIADPYVAGSTKTDADGAVVAFSITTRTLAGDSETQKLQARMTTRYQAAMPAASVAVTAQSKLDAADITAASVRALGSLSSTEPRTISAATNATPIACTTSVVHGLQSGDYVDINGGTGNTHVNGRWRVTVTGTTTFTLDASSGNGVYNASTASVKKVTETDFATNSLDLGQGVSFVIASSGTVNNFELHGLRIAYYEKPSPVMSA